MNYTLTLNLEGADQVDSMLDKLSKGVSNIGSSPKISFDKWLSAGSEADGEKVGKKFGTGLISGWGKAIITGKNQLNKFWNDAVNFGNGGLPGIKGLRDVTGKDLAKVMGLGDITQFDKKIEKPDWKKILIGAGLGFTNPYIGSRLLSDELGKGGSGQGGVSGGLFGKGGIAGFSEIYLAFKGFKIAVDTFRHIVESALAKAFDIYTQAAQTGLNTQFFAQRQAIAGLLGVSGNPNQIFMFGKAVQELAQRSSFATNIIAGNSRALFNTSVNFKILKLDTEALYSEIASKLAPALNLAVMGIDFLTQSLTKMISTTGILKFELEVLSHLPGGGMAWIARSISALANLLTNANQLSPVMKQLPASSWEHMGLAIGQGSNTTNNLIKKSNQYLQTIAGAVTMHGSGSSGQFGLSPTTSNP